jgi:hypothetical protein
MAEDQPRDMLKDMPKFSIKELLLATTLIAVGSGMVSLVFMLTNVPKVGEHLEEYAAFTSWFGGGAMIGAGILTPFKRPWLGAVIGLVVQLIIRVTSSSQPQNQYRPPTSSLFQHGIDRGPG